jgi:hypothetical protein
VAEDPQFLYGLFVDSQAMLLPIMSSLYKSVDAHVDLDELAVVLEEEEEQLVVGEQQSMENHILLPERNSRES